VVRLIATQDSIDFMDNLRFGKIARRLAPVSGKKRTESASKIRKIRGIKFNLWVTFG
jgi:hypothetical protein